MNAITIDDIFNMLNALMIHFLASNSSFAPISFGTLKYTAPHSPKSANITKKLANEIINEYKPNSSLVSILVKKMVSIKELSLNSQISADLKLKFSENFFLVCVEKNIL